MGKTHDQLDIDERYEIYRLREAGVCLREIGRQVAARLDSRGSAIVRKSGMDIVYRGSECLSAEVGDVQPFDEPVLPLVPGAEGGEEAGELRRLSTFPGTLA